MIAETMRAAEEKMAKAIAVAKEDFSSIRTGRANPAMFNKILADYYGTPTPVNQLASFHSPEPSQMIVTPYDKGALSAIEKSIRDSDLGVNPVDDGAIIRISFPPLTEERRKEFIKVAKHKAEDARVAVRNVRRHAKDDLDKLQKDGDAGEDDIRRAEKQLDDMTHKFTGQVDDLLKHKEAELLEV
ncbi:MAG: ribosome recycling factor [Actinomycetes bacterium]